jgi:hypothetical protein
MISIIICSIKEHLFDRLKSSIIETIGDVDHEFIRIDNSIEKLPITKAYNRGASIAKYKNLLFVHEDVLIHTKNWGQVLLRELNIPDTGIIGIAGSSYVPNAPCGYTNPVRDYNFHYLLQGTKTGSLLYNKIPESNTSIKAIDGVFMAIRKDVFEKFKFNEELPGFHGYDLDLSLRVSITLKNRICEKILIEHRSQGTPNEEYHRNNILIKRNIVVVNDFNDPFNEYSAYRAFIHSMIEFNFTKAEIKSLSSEFRNLNRFGMIHYLKSFFFTIKIMHSKK